MKRRASGEGTIYWSKRRKEWVGAMSVDGKRLYKYGKQPEEILEWLANMRGGQSSAKPAAETVADFLDQWLIDCEGWLRPKTLISYEFVIRQYLKPVFGTCHLCDLTAQHLQTEYRVWLLNGTSKRMVELCHGVLRSALEQAVRLGKVGANVARQARAPRPDRAYGGRVWEAGQVRQFISSLEAQNDRLASFYILEIATGLRMGEILGLHWEDVDLARGRLRVSRQLQRLPGEGLVESQPKSSSGRRPVEVAAPAVEGLKSWKLRQEEERATAPSGWKETPYVFTTPIGTPLDCRNVYHHFRRKSKELGLPLIRFHDLRHTCATLLLEKGIQPKVVQEILGHSSINITLELYAHVLPSMQEEAARAMGEVLTG